MAFCVAALGFAGYRLFSGPSYADKIPDDPQLRAGWACTNCGRVYMLTPREQFEWQQEASDFTIGGKRASDRDGTEGGRTSTREIVLGCRECKQMTLRRAAVCPTCRTAFTPLLKGKPNPCPRCGHVLPLPSDEPPPPKKRPAPSRDGP